MRKIFILTFLSICTLFCTYAQTAQRIVCTHCKGNKNFQCTVCQGKGMILAWRDLQYKWVTCWNCKGNKVIACEKCLGRGYKEKYYKECPICRGRRVCNRCAGWGKKIQTNRYNGRSKMTDCSYCRGGGLCPHCNGKGGSSGYY